MDRSSSREGTGQTPYRLQTIVSTTTAAISPWSNGLLYLNSQNKILNICQNLTKIFISFSNVVAQEREREESGLASL